MFHIAFCGKIYVIIKFDDVFYYNPDFNQLTDGVKEFVLDYNKRYFHILKQSRLNYYSQKRKIDYHFVWNLKETDFNERFNEPILLLSGSGKIPICANIKLSDYGFQKVLTAEEVYLQINNFLSREKIFIDKRNDVEKLLSNGFDVKSSFRNV